MSERFLRADLLEILRHCPVCCAGRVAFSRLPDDRRSASSTFLCGAVFTTIDDSPIKAEPCPVPSQIAVKHCEDDVLKTNISRGVV